MNNNWKTFFHIDSGVWKDQLFEILDTVESNHKDETDEFMNDSDRNS